MGRLFADVSHALEATMPTTDQLMTPTEVARMLNVTTKTLREWRRAVPKRGPDVCKLHDGKSSSVRYRAAAVTAWLDERTK